MSTTHALRLIIFVVSAVLFFFSLSFLFLSIESLDPQLQLEFDELKILSNASAWVALARTTIIALAAGVLGIALTEWLIVRAKRLKHRANLVTIILLFSILLVYSVDPVIRVKSSKVLFGFLDSLVSQGARLDVAIFSNFIAPTFILVLAYSPVYFILRILGADPTQTFDHLLPYKLSQKYAHYPNLLNRLPIGMSFMTFLGIFDSWSLAMVGGNKINFFGPFIITRAQDARDVEGAMILCVLGLLIALAVWAAFRWICKVELRRIRSASPVNDYTTHKVKPGSMKSACSVAASVVLCILCAFPILWIAHELFTAPDGARAIDFRSVVNSLIFSLAVGFSSIYLAVIATGTTQGPTWISKTIIPCLAFLALLPEVTYIIISTFATGSKTVAPGALWALFLFITFSFSMASLALNSFLTTIPDGKRQLLIELSQSQPIKTGAALIQEYRGQLACLFLFVVWISLDNVLLARAATGPNFSLAAPEIHSNATRIIDASDAAVAFAFSLTRFAVFLASLYFIWLSSTILPKDDTS